MNIFSCFSEKNHFFRKKTEKIFTIFQINENPTNFLGGEFDFLAPTWSEPVSSRHRIMFHGTDEAENNTYSGVELNYYFCPCRERFQAGFTVPLMVSRFYTFNFFAYL